MLAQMYCLMKLENYEQYLPEGLVLDTATLSTIYRFSVEEILRRCLKADMQPLSKTQVLKIFMPDYEEFVEQVMTQRAVEIKNQMKGGSAGDAKDNE